MVWTWERSAASPPQAVSRYDSRRSGARSSASARMGRIRFQESGLTFGVPRPSEVVLEERARHLPVPIHGPRRDTQGRAGLIDVQAREIAQRYQFGQLRVVLLERCQGLIERQPVDLCGCVAGDVDFLERHTPPS